MPSKTDKQSAKKSPAVKTSPKAQSPKAAKPKVEKESRIAGLTIERMAIKALKPHPRNPRKHPEPGSTEWTVLETSLKHDYFDPLVWNKRNGMLVSGHLRAKVFTHLGYTHADVVVVNYDEPTHIARLMAANKSIGENDFSAMKSLFTELRSVDGFDMAVAGFSLPEVDDLFADSPEGEDGSGPVENPNIYSGKIDAPHYKITGACPTLNELTLPEKSDQLIGEINKAKIPDDVKGFLCLAAERHRIFDYEKIAEYYAHAPKSVQRLMEKSALVIIDFDSAVANGFVHLSQRMKSLYMDNPKKGDDAKAGE